jgi:hypothetical protein
LHHIYHLSSQTASLLALPSSSHFPQTFTLPSPLFPDTRGLAASLPKAFTLSHSADTSSGSAEAERHSEINLVAANLAGGLPLIELKATVVDSTPTGIHKHDAHHSRDITPHPRLQ